MAYQEPSARRIVVGMATWLIIGLGLIPVGNFLIEQLPNEIQGGVGGLCAMVYAILFWCGFGVACEWIGNNKGTNYDTSRDQYGNLIDG